MLTKTEARKAMEIVDLSKDESGINPINLILKMIKAALEKAGYPKPQIRRMSPLTTVEENFDRLLISEDDGCRSPIQTRYVEGGLVLRTQSSAMIPSVLRERPFPDDILVMCPGLVYRRDVIDRIHAGAHHQMDVWRIKRGGIRAERKDLVALLETVIGCVFPNPTYRINEKTHPYTENGAEIEVLYKGRWVEVLEGGEISPVLLSNFGLDPEQYSGVASGFGLDRLAMMVKDMDDIRLLRSKDPRIVKQMQNLEKYRPVSNKPAITRDISIVVDGALVEEDVCEKIRTSVGESELDIVEEIKILNDTSYDNLPESARKRLGMQPGQKNMLIRLVIRSIERTLKKEEADIVRNAVYLAVHESDVKELI